MHQLSFPLRNAGLRPGWRNLQETSQRCICPCPTLTWARAWTVAKTGATLDADVFRQIPGAGLARQMGGVGIIVKDGAAMLCRMREKLDQQEMTCVSTIEENSC